MFKLTPELDSVPLSDLLLRATRDAVPLGQLIASKGKRKVILTATDDDIPISELIRRNCIIKKRTLSTSKAKTKAKKVKKDDSKKSRSSSSSSPKRMRKDADDSQYVGGSEVFPVTKYEQHVEIAPLVASEGIKKWWNEDNSGEESGNKWDKLAHNGVLFPDAYVPHGVKLLYNGNPVNLTDEQEEIATFYAQMTGSDYLNNEKFVSNFFLCFQESLGPNHVIKDLNLCDFSDIYEYLLKRKEELKERRKDKDVRAALKAENERLREIYGYALVDECRQKVANFKVEPPGLFRGRGDHPKTGMLKKRVMPEEIILNLGIGEKIPKCPIPGHNWKGIVHSKNVTWLAYWKENINGGTKYIWLHSSSQFKTQSDFDKYEKARMLKNHIGNIRKNYTEELDSNDILVQQRATATWIIDRLALRAGNEKDTDDEADTVGCCSLRVEHLKFESPNTVIFDFLGKDSMRYYNAVKVHVKVFRNLKAFVRNQPGDSQVFSQLSTTLLNQHLKSLMPGLTAKVFRTYNASYTLEKELDQGKPITVSTVGGGEEVRTVTVNSSTEEKVTYFNNANREVAILCNHQRTVPKNFDEQLSKLDDKVADLDVKKVALEEILTMFEKRTPESKLSERGLAELNPVDKNGKAKSRLTEARVRTMIKKIPEQKLKLEKQKQLKLDNKTVSLTTSKINYIDPRISVTWAKKMQVPIEKVFQRSLLVKFPWAMEANKKWSF